MANRLYRMLHVPLTTTALLVVSGVLAQTLLIPDFRQSANVRTLNPGETCNECGRVISVREIQIDRRSALPASFQGSARGPVEHNLVGAVVYLPLDGGSNDRPFVGGVGTPEMKERFAQSTYEVTIRMQDGSMRSLQRPDGSRYHVGDRVRLTASGELEWIAE
jgi:outer membrane lipoprotein SlyB